MDDNETFKLNDILPDDVFRALITLLEYQERRDWKISFSTVGPFTTDFGKNFPKSMTVKIENVSRKLVHNFIQAGARRGYSGVKEVTEIYHACEIEGHKFSLCIVGDKEKRMKEIIANAAEKSGRQAAEWVAIELLSKAGVE